MFEEGDLVVIDPKHPDHCWPDSPALNLKGSICRIDRVVFVGGKTRNQRFYHLKILEPHIKNPKYYDGIEGGLNWEDDHLSPYEDEMEDLDVSILFED